MSWTFFCGDTMYPNCRDTVQPDCRDTMHCVSTVDGNEYNVPVSPQMIYFFSSLYIYLATHNSS